MQPYIVPPSFEGFVSIIKNVQHNFPKMKGGSKFIHFGNLTLTFEHVVILGESPKTSEIAISVPGGKFYPKAQILLWMACIGPLNNAGQSFQVTQIDSSRTHYIYIWETY